MTSASMGSFGTYKYLKNRKRLPNSLYNDDPKDKQDDTVWVVMRYTPNDMRATAPVPRYKLLTPAANKLPPPAQHWKSANEAHPQNFTRDKEETHIYRSLPSTRCEEWSTLRQMLPSRGYTMWERPPNWGTSYADAPARSAEITRRFSRLSTPMSRYVQDI